MGIDPRARLFEAACAARERAYAPYSKHAVGAALEFGDALVTACNLENRSYALTLCAERALLVVPDTLSEDGDPTDVVLLIGEPTVPGCRVEARVVGVLYMEDEAGVDPKLLCVAARDPRAAQVRDLTDLPGHLLRELEHFFTRIKDLELDKWARVDGFGSRSEALEILDRHRTRGRS